MFWTFPLAWAVVALFLFFVGMASSLHWAVAAAVATGIAILLLLWVQRGDPTEETDLDADPFNEDRDVGDPIP